MLYQGDVVGGQYVRATVDINRKGELALTLGFRKVPSLTADTVASWEEIISEGQTGAAAAVSKVGGAVVRAALPGLVGKAASAAVGSVADLAKNATHTVRVDWIDGKQSLVKLPDRLFQHLAILLKDRRIASAEPVGASPETSSEMDTSASNVLGQGAQLATTILNRPPDVAKQIAQLAQLHDQGVLTEDEFTAKKTELLGRI